MITDETKIDELDLSVRAFNSLMRAGITTVGELQKQYREGGREWLQHIRYMEPRAVAEVEAKLQELDGKVLTLRKDNDLIQKLYDAGVTEIHTDDRVSYVRFVMQNGQVVLFDREGVTIDGAPTQLAETPALSSYQQYMAAMMMAIVANTSAIVGVESLKLPYNSNMVESSDTIMKSAMKMFEKLVGMSFEEWSKGQ